MLFWQAYCFIDEREFMFKNQLHVCDRNTAITATACALVSRRKGKGQDRILKQGADLACTTVPWQENGPVAIPLYPHHRGTFRKVTMPPITGAHKCTSIGRKTPCAKGEKRWSIQESFVICKACKYLHIKSSSNFDSGTSNQYHGKC
jgi:hypothetical protein